MPAYEISNHAGFGQESRHNLVYWRYGDYVGVGPGAHGRFNRQAVRQHRAPDVWLQRVEHGSGQERRDPLDESERLIEMTMMGLRLTAGIKRNRFRNEFGRGPEHLFDQTRLKALTEGGFLVCDEDGLRATEAGLTRLNAVLGHLLA
jgi:oxygen-independent coproporphyrinogen-3 oxidase